jgi:Glycosyltransferase like family
MSKLFISICSRSGKEPKSLKHLQQYVVNAPASMNISYKVCYDADSIYAGHQQNVDSSPLSDDDIVVMCHDDVEIISNYMEFEKYLAGCNEPGVGFVGVAGAVSYGSAQYAGAWWAARAVGETSGFVFQGNDPQNMSPNYFGSCGQVVVLDGCFLACSFSTLKKVGLTKPEYLTSKWDFYDIHMTLTAALMKLENYTVPIIVRHESPGEMREAWYKSRDEFLAYHNKHLPLSLVQ